MRFNAKLLQRIEANDKNLTQVNLKSNQIGDEGAKALAAALEKNKTVTEVYLGSNNIGAEGAKALGAALEKNHTLTQVSLDSNRIGAEGAKALGAALEKNHTLTQVSLDSNWIGDEGAKALGAALEKNQTLTKVDLGSNLIGDEGAKALAAALEKNHTLTQIDLGLNSIGAEGAKALGAALEKNQTLTQIYLDHNKIGAEGAKALGAALEKNQTLTKVNLGSNLIGDEGAKALAAALEKNHTLTQIDLGSNKIGAEGAKALGAALEKNQSLTWVYLGWNNIGAEGAKALGAALEKNQTLTQIDLDHNKIGDEGAKALVAALEKNHTLTQVNLGYNKIGDGLLKSIQQKVDANRANAEALIKAVQQGGFNTVKVLVTQGASLTYKDKDGNTALDIAIKAGHQAIVDYLKAQRPQSLAIITQHSPTNSITNISHPLINNTANPYQQGLVNSSVSFKPSPLSNKTKEDWCESLKINYTYRSIKRANESSQHEDEAEHLRNLSIPFTYQDGSFRKEVQPDETGGNVCLSTLIIGYKVPGTAKPYRYFKYSLDKEVLHVSTEYEATLTQTQKEAIIADLKRYHPNDSAAIDKLANGGLFALGFHHSERALYKYLETHIETLIAKFKEHLVKEQLNPQDVKASFMVLDVLSTHYQCNWCTPAAEHFQSPQSVFITQMQAGLEKAGINLSKNHKPLYMLHRYAAEQICKNETVKPKDKHNEVEYNIKLYKKKQIGLLLKQDNRQLYGDYSKPALFVSNKQQLKRKQNEQSSSSSAQASSSTDTPHAKRQRK